MDKVRRGDALDVTLVIRNKVGINDVYIVFVHEEDYGEHIVFGAQGKEGKDKIFPPSIQTTLSWDLPIDETKKLGV